MYRNYRINTNLATRVRLVTIFLGTAPNHEAYIWMNRSMIDSEIWLFISEEEAQNYLNNFDFHPLFSQWYFFSLNFNYSYSRIAILKFTPLNKLFSLSRRRASYNQRLFLVSIWMKTVIAIEIRTYIVYSGLQLIWQNIALPYQN